jgi:hypothetical protein
MPPTRPVALATLLPALLEGCLPYCPGPSRQDHTELVWVPEEMALEDCDALCAIERLSSYVVELEEVHSCERATDTELPSYPRPEAPGDVPIWCSYTAQVDEPCKGRAHATVVPPEPLPSQGPLRDWLARAAWEEAASVGAFRRLARELARHGAPAALVRRAREAALDEIGHARAMRDLLRGSVPRVRFGPLPHRTLRALALENAVEGCLHETYAALVAHHQARLAAPALRPLFARIARDETAHGQWSWDLDSWLRTRLSPAEQDEVDARRCEAAQVLVQRLSEPPPAVRDLLGVPSAETGRRLARALAAALVSAPDRRARSARA